MDKLKDLLFGVLGLIIAMILIKKWNDHDEHKRRMRNLREYIEFQRKLGRFDYF